MNFLISFFLASQFLLANLSPKESIDARHQALYLYNIVRYIDWKTDKTVIGIVGETKVIPELTKMINGDSKVEVMSIAVDKVKSCDVIFLSNVSSREFYQVQQQVGHSSKLVIVDQKHLVLRGAEVGFYEEDQKLKVGVNKDAIKEAGIKISNTFLSKVSSL